MQFGTSTKTPVLLLGDAETMTLPQVAAGALASGLKVVGKVEFDPEQWDHSEPVTSHAPIREALIQASDGQLAIFLPYPTDLTCPRLFVELVGVSEMLGVGVMVGLNAQPWNTTLLPGFAANDLVTMTATSWRELLVQSSGQLMIEELTTALGQTMRTQRDISQSKDESQKNSPKSRGLRRAISEMKAAGLKSHEIAVILNALQVAPPSGSAWKSSEITNYPSSQAKLTVQRMSVSSSERAA